MVLREAANKLAEEVSEETGDDEIMARVCDAANELDRTNGFSPLQLMTGRSPDYFSALSRDAGNAALMEAESSPGHPIAKKLETQCRAQTAFLQAHASSRLRRAALARPRRPRIGRRETLSTTGA